MNSRFRTACIIAMAGMLLQLELPLAGQADARPSGAERRIASATGAPLPAADTSEGVEDPGLARRISLRLDDAGLSAALREIATAAELSIAFSDDVVPADRKVSLVAVDLPAAEAFRAVLDGTGARVVVSSGGQVVIVPGRNAPLQPATAAASLRASRVVVQGAITGRVTRASGEPLPGTQIVVVGTRFGALSAADGSYTISGVPDGSHRVQATRIGFAERTESVVVTSGGRAVVNFSLEPTAVQLEGVVAVGYGTQRRRDVTGSVGSVSGEDFKREPIASVAQVLQGRVAGVRVMQPGGQPGAAPSIRIRGGTSISAGNEPLYVIDGVPVYNDDRAFSTRSANAVSALSSINPNDIESIEILKDASATAIYGARGANGVVMITTKRGRAGQSDMEIEAYYGTQRVARTLPLLNATEYGQFLNEAYVNAGRPAPYPADQLAALGKGTDWQDALMRVAPIYDLQTRFRGGTEQIRYSLGGGYFRQDGIILGSHLDRASFRVNLDGEVSSRLSVGNNLMVSRTSSNVAQQSSSLGGLVATALALAPTLPVRNADGDYTRENVYPGNPAGNPVASALNTTDTRQAMRILGNVFADYSLLDALKLRVNLGVDNSAGKDNFYLPGTLYEGQGSRGSGSVGSVTSLTWLNENTLTYDASLGDRHDLRLLGGMSLQKQRAEQVVARGENFPNGITEFNDLSAASALQPATTGSSEWALESYLARANYSFADRYLFTATARLDGSSRFGAANKRGFFPSAALAWHAGEEEFVRRLGVFGDLKFRASYGLTGNQEIPIYQSLAALRVQPALFGEAQVVGYAPNRVANPDLRWETTRQTDVGVDMGLFGNALRVTGDYYVKTTNDLLLDVPIPMSSGFASALQNVGSVRNRGVELALDLDQSLGPVLWRSGLQLSKNRTTVLDLGSLGSFTTGEFSGAVKLSGVVKVEEGGSLGHFYGFVSDGIFQTPAEVAASAQKNAKPGEIRYQDLNGDGAIDNNDRAYIGSAEPDLTGGWTNSLTFGPVELNVFLQGSYGNDIVNGTSYFAVYTPSGGMVPTRDVLNRWTGPGTSNRIPRADLNAARPQFSDLIIEDGSYLRARNVSLSYEIPVDRFRVFDAARRARVYVSLQNAFTLTNYSGFDPEVNTQGAVLTPGVDMAAYPNARTATIGVNLGL